MKATACKAEVYMNKETKSHLQWVPLLITVCCAIATLLIYTLSVTKKNYIVFFQVISAAFVPAILPILSRATKKSFPVFLNILFSVHIILAVDLGCAMSFYDRFYYWDMLMHGCFGFLASVAFYILLLTWNGETLNRFGFFALIFLSTMGCAAVWEIFEFVSDRILNGDAQRVLESVAMGHTPVYDTMMDIIVATAGIGAFYGSLFIDRLCKTKFGKSLYDQVKYELLN